MYNEKIESHDKVFDYKDKLAEFETAINNPFIWGSYMKKYYGIYSKKQLILIFWYLISV